MASDDVTQKFIADVADYIEPIRDAAKAADDFAKGNAGAKEALDALRDGMASSDPVVRRLASAIHDSARAAAELAAEADASDPQLAAWRDALKEAADAAKAIRDKAMEAGTSGVPILDKAMKSARDKAAELAAASDFLDLSLDKMAKGTKKARDKLIELGFAEADATAGAAALAAAAKAAKDAEEGGGFFASLGSFFSSLSGLGSGLTSTPVIITAIAAAVAALLPELAGLAAGFTAAGLGVGAFALLAVPAFDKIKNGYTSVSQAQQAYHAAVQMEARDPTKANAQAVATALDKLKIAWSNLSPAARRGVDGIDQLKASYDKMVKAFTPDAMKVFDDGLRIANELLPQVKPFADTAATALHNMLKEVAGFFEPAKKAVPVTENMASAAQRLGINVQNQLTPWQQFTQYMHSLEGPALSAIGHGLGDVGTNLLKLLQVMSKKDVINAINIAFTVLSGSVHALTSTIGFLMKAWDRNVKAGEDIARWAQDVRKWFDGVVTSVRHATDTFDRFRDDVIGAVEKAGEAVGRFAMGLYRDVSNWINRTLLDVGTRWDQGWSAVVTFARSIPGRILGALGDLGGLLVSAGGALIRGLISGIESAIPGLESAISFVRGLVDSIMSLIGGAHSAASSVAPGGGAHHAVAGLAAIAGPSPQAAAAATQPIVVHVNLQNVMSTPRAQQALAAHVQDAIGDFASRAAGSFLVLPGKAAGF